jgi:hypothetical protein
VGVTSLSFLWSAYEVIRTWSWATIAAFAAAGAAIWVARYETKQRAALLGREMVVGITASSMRYHRDVLGFLEKVRDHINNRIPAEDLDKQAFPRLVEAITAMDRELKSARMACNDFEMQIRIAEAELHIYALLQSLDPRPAGAESQRARLDRIISDGLSSLQGFAAATEAFGERGFAVYSPRRGLKYRIANWRWDRKVKAEEKAQLQQRNNAGSRNESETT